MRIDPISAWDILFALDTRVKHLFRFRRHCENALKRAIVLYYQFYPRCCYVGDGFKTALIVVLLMRQRRTAC